MCLSGNGLEESTASRPRTPENNQHFSALDKTLEIPKDLNLGLPRVGAHSTLDSLRDGMENVENILLEICRLAKSMNIDVFVELIGGDTGPAKDAVEAAIANGKHVITANKALLAHHGASLARAAEAKNDALF